MFIISVVSMSQISELHNAVKDKKDVKQTMANGSALSLHSNVFLYDFRTNKLHFRNCSLCVLHVNISCGHYVQTHCDFFVYFFPPQKLKKQPPFYKISKTCSQSLPFF